MVSPILERELHQQLEHLMAPQQRQVLDFARALVSSRPRGVSGKELLPFAGSIESDDLKTIAQVIETDCGKVDANGW